MSFLVMMLEVMTGPEEGELNFIEEGEARGRK